MRRLFQILLFMVLCGGSALALLLLFPGLKEGAGRDELPLYAGTLAGLIAAALAWWFAVRRKAARAIGLVVLGLPILGHGAISISIVAAQIEGARLAKSIGIAAYRARPIEWRGFDGPVGLEIQLEINHPKSAAGLIYPPEIRMGPWIDIPNGDLVAAHRAGAGHFKEATSPAESEPLALLKTVLFRPVDQESSYQDFAVGGVTRLTYRVFPGAIAYLDEPDRICLASETEGLPICGKDAKPEEGCRSRDRRAVARPLQSLGEDLTALWFVAGGFGMIADLSAKLTETLRRDGTLQGDPEGWRGIQGRLEPRSLRSAGYELCPPGPKSHTGFRVCYCRG